MKTTIQKDGVETAWLQREMQTAAVDWPGEWPWLAATRLPESAPTKAPDLIVDTHGADIVDPVWDLLAYTYDRNGVRPTLLERDFNIPPLPQLLTELGQVRVLQKAACDRSATTRQHLRHAAL